jgi:hypothetical protein
MARLDGEVTKPHPHRALLQALLDRGAERALEVGVLENQWRLGRPADVVVLVEGRRRRRAEVRQR